MLAATSITLLNLQPDCRQLKCIVGNVGIRFSQRMSGSVSLILILFVHGPTVLQECRANTEMRVVSTVASNSRQNLEYLSKLFLKN